MSNTNCLEGMACPECKADERFKISACTWAIIKDDGCDDHEDMEYGVASPCICVECQHSATVGEFLGLPAKPLIPMERMAVLSTGHVTFEDSKLITPAIRNGRIIGMWRDHGWLIHVDSEDEGLSSLRAVLSTAKDCGFHWVLLDSAGDQIAELPSYDW